MNMCCWFYSLSYFLSSHIISRRALGISVISMLILVLLAVIFPYYPDYGDSDMYSCYEVAHSYVFSISSYYDKYDSLYFMVTSLICMC